MKYGVYSIWDVKAGAFSVPFFLGNDRLALRAFRDLCVDESSQISRHPEDYILYKLDEWDDGVGEMDGRARELLLYGREVVREAISKEELSAELQEALMPPGAVEGVMPEDVVQEFSMKGIPIREPQDG